MKTQNTADTSTADQNDMNPLMAAYNPPPPQAEQPARFYWQEPWHDAGADAGANGAVQATFGN